MKKILVLAAALTFSLGMSAQDGKMSDNSKMHDSKGTMKKDHVMMKGGKMMMMKDGKMTPMSQDMTMSNGTMVMMDGSVKKSDGTTMMMKDGDGMDMSGNMMHHGNNKMSK